MNAVWPVAVRMVDVLQPLAPIENLDRYPRTFIYVRAGAELIGSIEIANAHRPVSAHRLRDAIADGLIWQFARHAMRAALHAPAGAREALPINTAVSIVVPTCGRPNDLRRCLSSLCSQNTPRHLEVLVVDNRPGTGGTRDVVRDFPAVHLIEERRPGLSYARNAGFAAARGEIVVATDDDVVMPPDWIEKLVAPFARPDVMVVTGNVLPLELETESQVLFEVYGGLGKGFERREVRGDWFHGCRGAVPTWTLGATANAAFRASAFDDPRIGVLDEALGAGTPAGCSEDSYLFYRILKEGHTLVYEPQAWVWHRHRAEMQELRDQIYSYSKGHVAYHLTTLLRERDRRALVRLMWSLPKRHLSQFLASWRGHSEFPLNILALEVAGHCMGPFALWRSRRRARRIGPGLRRHAANNPVVEQQSRPSKTTEARHAL